ncbi:dicarboxylate/amino acid:cation symporter [Streptococcus sp. zg-JUN1979]|uniref:dicarboxylate/amino acid:cation symporter n=1 Tax=Streptococcus sp. zg-JUN1979 TaxID=3391450 RepID=UPI0039A46F69
MTKELIEKIKARSGVAIVVALVLGVISGILFPQGSALYEFLGSAFIRLISAVILPLIVPIVVVSVAQANQSGGLSRFLVKTFGYFFIVTTLIIAVYVLIAYYLGFGQGAELTSQSTALDGIAKGVAIDTFLLDLIPNNIFATLASGALLPSVLFALIIGLALSSLDKDTSSIITVLVTWIDVMHEVTRLVVSLLPIGVFGFMAAKVSTLGVGAIASLAQFVFGTYIGYALLALLFFPLLAMAFGISYRQLLSSIWDLVALAFVSGSSSVVLPQLIERLDTGEERDNKAHLVLPLGYTFNLDGAVVYLSLATVFIAHSYAINLSLSQLFGFIVLLSLISKTIATIPSGAIVVLLAVANQLGLPEEGVAAILAVDVFLNAGRTALNVIGNALAVVILEGKSSTISSEDSELVVLS